MSTQDIAVAERMVADALAGNKADYLRVLSADFLKYVDDLQGDLDDEDAAAITKLAIVLFDAAARAGDSIARSVLAVFPSEMAMLREGHFNATMPMLASC